MSRGLSALVAVGTLAATAPARAQPAETSASVTPEDVGDQSVSAELGLAAGGRVTPGGLRVAGHYLYQLSADDWFDGTASFTFGSGGASCFRDRMNATICDHGLADGDAVEVSAAVRRMFAANGAFRPFARAGIGLAIVRFSDDDVSGLAFPIHVGGGVRSRVGPSIAVVAQADLQLGIGRFNHGLGIEPQAGLTVTAGAEFVLR